MATNETEIQLDDVKTLADQLMRNASGAAAPAFQQLAQWRKNRAVQLEAAADRLKTTLGEDHPRVMALNRAAASANAFRQVLTVEAVRITRRPTIEANEWLVFGRVFDEQGNPVPGLRVRVFDRDRKYDDLLGDTATDEYGDFAAKYHERDFAEVGEAQPDLYVMVEDAAGILLYSSRDKVRYEAGRAEYFEIVLSEKPTPPVAVKKRTRTAK